MDCVVPSKAASARMLEAQIQDGGTSLKTSGMLRARAAVGTEAVKLDGALALTVNVAGTEQVAPTGAPVQVNDAVPDMLAPPRLLLPRVLSRSPNFQQPRSNRD
jgi:hypothetical protein